MGTLGFATMASTPLAILLTIITVAAISVKESQAYNVDRNPFVVERRGYRDPDDPRNLFAAMYGANYKRSDPELGQLPELTPEMLEYLKVLSRRGDEASEIHMTQGTCSTR